VASDMVLEVSPAGTLLAYGNKVTGELKLKSLTSMEPAQVISSDFTGILKFTSDDEALFFGTNHALDTYQFNLNYQQLPLPVSPVTLSANALSRWSLTSTEEHTVVMSNYDPLTRIGTLRVCTNNGAPEVIYETSANSTPGGYYPWLLSPDGHWLAYYANYNQVTERADLMLLELVPGTMAKQLGSDVRLLNEESFDSGSRYLAFHDDRDNAGDTNLRVYDLVAETTTDLGRSHYYGHHTDFSPSGDLLHFLANSVGINGELVLADSVGNWSTTTIDASVQANRVSFSLDESRVHYSTATYQYRMASCDGLVSPQTIAGNTYPWLVSIKADGTEILYADLGALYHRNWPDPPGPAIFPAGVDYVATSANWTKAIFYSDQDQGQTFLLDLVTKEKTQLYNPEYGVQYSDSDDFEVATYLTDCSDPEACDLVQSTLVNPPVHELIASNVSAFTGAIEQAPKHGNFWYHTNSDGTTADLYRVKLDGSTPGEWVGDDVYHGNCTPFCYVAFDATEDIIAFVGDVDSQTGVGKVIVHEL
jgi:hypothetical protein